MLDLFCGFHRDHGSDPQLFEEQPRRIGNLFLTFHHNEFSALLVEIDQRLSELVVGAQTLQNRGRLVVLANDQLPVAAVAAVRICAGLIQGVRARTCLLYTSRCV